MGQFIKFTFASCLGVFIAFSLLMAVFVMIGIGAASAGKTVVVEDDTVLKLDLDYFVPEHTNNITRAIFQFQHEDILGLHDILDVIASAKSDDRIEGIYLIPTQFTLGTVKTAAIAEAIRDFKTSGKWVLSYAEFYPQGGYALAAQADTVMLNPIGSVDMRGYASFVPFFKELFDKTGIKMNIYYAGEFKSATEPFRRTDMSPENKLQTREYLEDAYAHYLKLVSEGRNTPEDRLFDIADNLKSRNANDALTLGLVDVIAYEDEALSWMRRRIGLDEDDDIRMIEPEEYNSARSRESSTSQNRIAVVYAEGEIVAGKGDYGLIGDQRYTDILADLRKDNRVKAVVLRINSPGGNILAAENILREVSLLKAEGKPVVASMSDYAASGGYYIAANADSIFAEPTTLTGSIGVFTMMPNVEDFLGDKIGIRFDTVKVGEYSAGFTPFVEWSEGEHAYMKFRTDEFYDLFLTHVSKSRKMTKDEVHEVAQGRIWSGDRALSIGLIDGLGSLEDAVQSAAAMAEIEDYRTTEYPRVMSPLNRLLAELQGEDVSISERYVEQKIEKRIPHYRELRSILRLTEPMARLPVILKF